MHVLPPQTAPDPPAWVVDARAWEEAHADAGGLRAIARPGGCELVEAVVEPGASQSPEGLRHASETLYRQVLAAAEKRGLWPLRFWNFVPGITEPAGSAAVHRYMRFNEGRAAGMAASGFAGHRVAASAVGFPTGHPRPRLTVQALLGPVAAAPAENPRQVPAWRYSERFGPTPPTFARAAVLPRAATAFPGALLLAGTAAVVGERSVHEGNLEAQLAETCTNLAVLLGEAAGEKLPEGAPPREEDRRLTHLLHLRVYVTRAADLQAVAEGFAARCPRVETLTLMHAPLCRPELLLEAEGVSREALAS